MKRDQIPDDDECGHEDGAEAVSMLVEQLAERLFLQAMNKRTECSPQELTRIALNGAAVFWCEVIALHAATVVECQCAIEDAERARGDHENP